MPPLTIQQAFSLALQRHQAGQTREAEQLYRQILAQQPDHVNALHYLGVIAHQAGRGGDAVNLIRRAIALQPNNAVAYSNLGLVLRTMGQLDEAIAAFSQAIILNPGGADAHSNLGMVLKDAGRLDEAIAECRRAIALRPNHAEAFCNLANAQREAGQLDAALAASRQAIVLNPALAEAHCALGNALQEKGQLDEAVAAYRQAAALRPGLAEAHNNLGIVLKDQGQIDQALAAFRRAIGYKPDYLEAHSNLLYTLHFHSDYDAGRIAEEHRRWNRQFAAPLRNAISSSYPNGMTGDRRLRIGYVSPNFSIHPVGRFLAPLLDHHDRRQFEIFCYSDVKNPDAMTGRLQGRADAWRNILQLKDEAAAALIRQDKIDILVDLTMHMGNNRLLVFARKPAPVQVTYLAYCSTTGLDAMDYRLTDPWLDPPGDGDQYYSEKSVRLSDGYWCYEPPTTAEEIAPSPALAGGGITFGCLNNFAKDSPEALAAWIRLLRAAPSARLLLHARQGEHRRRLFDQFRQQGVDPARLTFVGLLQQDEYFRQYQRIDIGLDPFPCAGGTTTCDALWMGVPVITLAGRTAVGRSGVTLLNNIGLSDLVTRTPEEYIERAAQLAGDLVKLAELRAGLRDRMRRSPLMDGLKFARNVEAAYLRMWQQHCETVHANG